MRVENNVMVAMRDGVRLSLCIYRPDAEGRFPALFAASPYQHAFDQVPAYPLFLWRETGPIEWYVGQGYAYVHADVRGSGQSEGDFGFMDRAEQDDYVELIAWIGNQAWCNGRVGGIGQSYYAMAQWLMAVRNPQHLACIVPYDGLVDQYRCSNYHGGIFCSYRPGWYINLMADNQHRPAGGRGRARMTMDLAGDIVAHPLCDDWWKERSRVRAASPTSRCPCCRSATGARWACTCAAISSATSWRAGRRSSWSPARATRSRRTTCSIRSNFTRASCCRSTTAISRASTTA